jgi:hypothetical protein
MRPQVAGIYLDVTLCGLLCACGATATGKSALPPLPEPATVATLAGPLCEGDTCRCADAPGAAGTPSSTAVKRYEVRIGPADNELWVFLDRMVLYKSNERPSECFYVDLPSGDHPVGIRARGDNGFGARVAISELTRDASAGYATFEFRCGGPGICSTEMLDEYKAGLSRYTRNIHDPCGSTKIKQLRWDLGRMPDKLHPSEIFIELVLDVYNFAPSQPPGHPDCADNY